ncbi:MAG: sigma 54-interacting transcriptional regulator, partial [Albidovulum sp.]
YQGLIEQSEGGTLFLDEVGEIPMSAQALLLRFLEDGLITRLAGGQHRVVNVRVIAATNRDLRQLVRDGTFRADLYYRLAVVPLHVPPLRVMPALADHLITRFLQTINQRRQTPMLIPQRLRDRLLDYGYPGNIRELSNIIQKLAIFMEDSEDLEEVMGDLLSPIDIPGLDGALAGFAPGAATFDLKTEVRRYERILIDKAIRVHGSKRKAANALGVDIGTIVRKTAEPSEATTMAKEDQTNMGDHGK